MALWLDSIADLEPASYLGSTDEADVPASAAGTGTLLQGVLLKEDSVHSKN